MLDVTDATTETSIEPGFARTIPRELVHKAGPEAVWLSDITRTGDHEYLCAGHVPRTHTLVNDSVAPHHTYDDLAFLTELGRQAGIATMHAFEGAPVDWATVFMKFDLALTDPAPCERSASPLPALVRVRFPNRERPDEHSLQVFAEMEFEVDGVVRATSSSLAAAYEKGPYQAWRAEMREAKPLSEASYPHVEPIAPQRVARRLPENVMIGEPLAGEAPETLSFPVVVDQRHPHFFEHPMDHIPGVVHVEALRQAAKAAACETHDLSPASAVVTTASIRFAGFAELELPMTCHTRVGEVRPRDDGFVDVPVRLRLSQPGDPKVTSARMVIRTRPA